uniref:Regulator of G protein signaling 13 n=1 Tax=Amphilophus citrinellus TaxID=61819 RepID=A0A3Q0RXI9_AMPCI
EKKFAFNRLRFSIPLNGLTTQTAREGHNLPIGVTVTVICICAGRLKIMGTQQAFSHTENGVAFLRFLSDGLATFRNFLKSEYSDENIEFWLTCEDYKKIKSSFRMSSRAKKIYEQFIKAESPKEINIDYHTREQIKRNVKTPTMHCFDDAQKIVYGLMERDSYPRFLRSDIYRTLLESLAADATNG